MPTVKLYGAAASLCTSRVIAAIYEKEVTDWELVPVSMAKGEHKTPEFLAMQPFGQVPALVYGDLTLFESRAIARAVANKFVDQGTPLYGSTPKDKALVEVWMEVEGQNYGPPVGNILWEKVFKMWVNPAEKTDQAVVDANVEKVTKVLDVYEAQLAKHKYLAGDFFSLADLTNLPATYKLVHAAKLGDLVESRPHVKAWFDDISSRPAWKKTLALAAAA
ncbi:unnamed protein product [Calypogeia fissa]